MMSGEDRKRQGDDRKQLETEGDSISAGPKKVILGTCAHTVAARGHQGRPMNRTLLTVLALLVTTSAWGEKDREINNTTTKTKTIEMRLEPTSGVCQATASLDYFQRGNEAQVETSIDTGECGPAKGSYVVKLTIRADGEEESRVLDFEETWERGDDSPVESMRRYPIGDDVDLLRVRTRKLSCTCTEQDATVQD